MPTVVPMFAFSLTISLAAFVSVIADVLNSLDIIQQNREDRIGEGIVRRGRSNGDVVGSGRFTIQ